MENPLSGGSQRAKTDICMFTFTCAFLSYADSHFKINFNLFDSTTEFRCNIFFLSTSFCVYPFLFLSSGKGDWKVEVSDEVGVIIHFFICNPKAKVVLLVTQRWIIHLYAEDGWLFWGVIVITNAPQKTGASISPTSHKLTCESMGRNNLASLSACQVSSF